SSRSLMLNSSWSIPSSSGARRELLSFPTRRSSDLDDVSEEAASDRSRLTDSVETALALGSGIVIINDVTDPQNPSDHLYSEHLYCPYDGTSIPPIEPRTFSFNTSYRACPECQGSGVQKESDTD